MSLTLSFTLAFTLMRKPAIAVAACCFGIAVQIFVARRPQLVANSVGIVLPLSWPFLHLKAAFAVPWVELMVTEWGASHYFTPGHDFGAQGTVPPKPDYTQDSAWAALWPRVDTADIVPAGASAAPLTLLQENLPCDVFYLHPTTFFSASGWNAEFDNPAAAQLVDEGIVFQQAGAWNHVCRVYAPRIRQMTAAGYFERYNGEQALDLAYTDARAAFLQFLQRRGGRRPIILASHSQGTTLMERLLLEFFAHTSSKLRPLLVAAYLLGMELHDGPYSWSGKAAEARRQDEAVAARRGRVLLPLCESATQSGCVVSFRSFLSSVDVCTFLSRPPVAGTRVAPRQRKVCTNPLTWTAMGHGDGDGGAGAHRGCMPIVHPWANLRYLLYGEGGGATSFERLNGSTSGIDLACSVRARCTEDGGLRVEMPFLQRSWAAGFPVPFPAWTVFTFPGQNTHAYDYNYFYNNLRENGAARLEAWRRDERAPAFRMAFGPAKSQPAGESAARRAADEQAAAGEAEGEAEGEAQRERGFEPVAGVGPGAWRAAGLGEAGALAGTTWDGHGNWEYQMYTSDHARILDGGRRVELLIERRSAEHLQRHGEPRLLYESGKVVHDNGGRGFGLGTLMFTVTNPRALPYGAWPCVWLLGRGSEWPRGGEIDMLEMLPIDFPRKISSAVHYGPSAAERHFVKGERSASSFGRRIEVNMTRTVESIRIACRSSQPDGGWRVLKEVNLDDAFVAGASEALRHSRMDLIANIAVGADALQTKLAGVNLKASPTWFDWAFKKSSWEISRIIWLGQD